jgi:hypothetical protein
MAMTISTIRSSLSPFEMLFASVARAGRLKAIDLYSGWVYCDHPTPSGAHLTYAPERRAVPGFTVSGTRRPSGGGPNAKLTTARRVTSQLHMPPAAVGTGRS